MPRLRRLALAIAATPLTCSYAAEAAGDGTVVTLDQVSGVTP